MLDHGNPTGPGIGLVALILAGKDVNLRLESLLEGAIAIAGDDMKQRLAAAGRRVAPGKTGRDDRDKGRCPCHPGIEKRFVRGKLLAGPGVAELRKMPA